MIHYYEICFNDSLVSDKHENFIFFWSKQRLKDYTSIVNKAVELGHISNKNTTKIKFAHKITQGEFRNITKTSVHKSYYPMIELLSSLPSKYKVVGFRKPVSKDMILLSCNSEDPTIVEYNSDLHFDESYLILKYN